MNAPPNQPAHDPALFYRSMTPQQDLMIYREGQTIVFYKGVPVPDGCIKCGAPANRTVRTTLQWHTPWLYVLIFFPGLLIYAIVATMVSERAQVAIPLCELHRTRRVRMIAIAWVLALSSIVAPFALGAFDPQRGDASGLICAASVFGLLAACIVGIVGSRLLTPTFIDARVVKARGAGEAFLARCPPTGWYPQ